MPLEHDPADVILIRVDPSRRDPILAVANLYSPTPGRPPASAHPETSTTSTTTKENR